MKHCTNTVIPLSAVLLAFVLSTGCHTYYKAQKVLPGSQAMKKIDSLSLQNRYFVLREGSHAYHMDHLELNNGDSIISCTLDSLPSSHQLHLVNGINHRRRYKKHDINQAGVIKEVHLYIQPDTSVSPGPCSLSASRIQKIEVLQKDVKRTTNSYVLGALGITAGIFVLTIVIVAASYAGID